MKRRDPKDDSDLKGVIIRSAIAALLIACILVALVALDYWMQDSPKTVRQYNQKVEAFNNLPLTERKICQSLFAAMVDDELHLQPKAQPKTFKQKAESYFSGFMLIWVIGTSLVTLLSYWERKNSKCYLASLPLKTARGWVILLLSLPTGWLFFLGSYLLMLHREEQKRAEEKIAAGDINESDFSTEGDSHKVITDTNARATYISMRTEGRQTHHEQAIKDARAQLKQRESTLAAYGERIINAQRDIGETKAELNQLLANPPDRAATTHVAKTEWEQILDMRGVTKVTSSRRKTKPEERFIKVLLKIRVPYHGYLYDFGDYEITFTRSDFKSKKIRSGVRVDHTNTYPTYPDGTYGFCFGSRLSDIQSYARTGRILEALTLITDCMHAVNPNDEQYIPGCYRKVKKLESRNWKDIFREAFSSEEVKS